MRLFDLIDYSVVEGITPDDLDYVMVATQKVGVASSLYDYPDAFSGAKLMLASLSEDSGGLFTLQRCRLDDRSAGNLDALVRLTLSGDYVTCSVSSGRSRLLVGQMVTTSQYVAGVFTHVYRKRSLHALVRLETGVPLQLINQWQVQPRATFFDRILRRVPPVRLRQTIKTFVFDGEKVTFTSECR